MSLCVGLTGGIGSGKSTVARLFAERGAGVVDADVISHQLTQADGHAMPLIADYFGAAYLDGQGALNRTAMRERIFSDPRAKADLERIVHPLILDAALTALKAHAAAPYTLWVVPLLFENPLFQQPVQRILVVDCPEGLQVTRVIQRSQLSADRVRSIIAQQTPRAERLRRADDVLRNEHDLEALIAGVDKLHRHYLQLAQQQKID